MTYQWAIIINSKDTIHVCLLSLPLTNVSIAFVRAAGHSPTGKIQFSILPSPAETQK